jgi:FkbM family methyltransferase
MNRLAECKKDFESGMKTKSEFIQTMYGMHLHLFDYSEFIKNTNVSALEIRDGKVIATFRDVDIKVICKPNDKRIVPFEAINFGSYERDELNMQLKLIEPAFHILDVGANDGWYAINFAKRFPTSKIYAFEPIPETYRYLTENISLNRIENINANNFGFSNAEGSFDFYFDAALSGNASLANVSGIEDRRVIRCTVKKMDDFIEENKIRIDFIKCDVEGAELLVLQGGMNAIKEDLPIIFSEMLRKWSAKFNYHPNDIIALLRDAGYQCFTATGGNLRQFDRVDEDTVETNYFFLHSKKHSQLIKKLVI